MQPMPVKQDMVVNMAFDPSIILGVKGLELPNPMNAMAQFSQIQNAQNQNALAQYQLSSAQRADEQQRSLYAAAQQPGFKLDFTTAVQYGAPGMAALKAQQEAQAAGLTQEKLRGEISAQTPKLQNDVSEQFKKQLTNVNDYDSAVNWLDKQYKHPVLGPLMAQMPFEEAVRQIPQDPTKFQEWKAKNALGIEEFIKQNKPSVTAQRTGALTRLLSTPGLGFGGATVVPGSEAAMTATPGEELRHKDAIARLTAESAVGVLSPQSIDLAANLYLNGQGLPALGMGKQAANLRSQIMNRASDMSVSAGGATAADAAKNIIQNKAETAGNVAGQRAVGTQIANVQIAANEATKMIDIARTYVDKVDPTDYPKVNAVGNYVALNTGDPNVVGLATSLNSLVNTYARAINPKGVATVSDKNHAREIVDKAMAKGQINEAFNVMGKEMGASLASGPEVRANMRTLNTGVPKPMGGNVVVTPDGQSHTFPNAAAAAQFKQAAGMQ